MSKRLMTPNDYLRWTKNLDVNTWPEFALAVYSHLIAMEKLSAFWTRNARAWPMEKKNAIEIRNMYGAGLEVLLGWEGLAKWRKLHPYDVPRIQKMFDQEKWQVFLDLLPLPG